MIKDIYRNVHRRSFYLWSSLLASILTVEILATVAIPIAKEMLFSGIEIKSVPDFQLGLMIFTTVLVVFSLCQGFKYYVSHRVGLILRTSITQTLRKRWFKQIATHAEHDNPDQRIAEDARLATESAIEVFIEVLVSVAIIFGLIIQMWGSWLLLGIAFGYTLLVFLAAMFFHRPMVNAEKVLQRAEADFRFNLASIVMQKARSSIKKTYRGVIDKYLYFTKVLMHFTVFNKIAGHMMSVIPFLVLVPYYFAGDITFGTVMKGVSQADLIVINAMILIILYPKFTEAIASWERIAEFYRGLK